jgi:hypothetical protein
LATIVFLWIFVVGSAFISGYNGQSWSESLVFKTSDGWCNNLEDGVGVHCFGDFGLGYFQGDFHDAFPVDYVPENFITTNTPMTILMFQGLGVFGYDTALAIYLALMTASVLFPLMHATRKLDRLDRSVAIVFGGVLSYGFLATLDRGNHIALLITPAYMYVLAIAQKQSKTMIWGAFLLCVLKFWGGVLLLPLVLYRHYKEFFVTISMTVIGYLVPLALFPGGFADALKTMFRVNASNEIAVITAPYNISANGLTQRIVCAVRRGHWCNTTEPANQYGAKGLVTGVVLVVALVCLVLIVKAFQNNPLLSLGSLMAVPQFVIPDAAVYSTVFSTCLLALSIQWGRGRQNHIRSFATTNPQVFRAFQIVLIATLVPIALTFSSLSWLASSNGSANPEFKIQYWLYPFVWLGFFLSCTTAAIKELLARRPNRLKLQRALSELEPKSSQAETTLPERD